MCEDGLLAKYLIQKSKPLLGNVVISGSKNAVLPLMAAAILTDERCVIRDTPHLKDVEVLKKLLCSLGATIEEVDDDGANSLSISTPHVTSTNPEYELVSKMRASVLVMGALLAREGAARIPLPGGCSIGSRPVDLHLKGFEALGATVKSEIDYVEAKTNGKRLQGASVYLDYPSVGATENIMMAAVLAEGMTYIENAAEEPEIIDLANFLNKMGAKIKGAGTDTIKIEGVEKLRGANHTVIPDRIETGTFMLAAAMTRGELLISNVVPEHVKPIIAKMRECGVIVDVVEEGIHVDGTKNHFVATDITTMPYPGFPTDMQSPFMAFLLSTIGKSHVLETVFENRFMHISELNRMGANINYDGNNAYIDGPKKLDGAEVIATDLRAGAALVLAGLVADGVTEISDIYHIERGYENFVEKFRKIGATIIRLED